MQIPAPLLAGAAVLALGLAAAGWLAGAGLAQIPHRQPLCHRESISERDTQATWHSGRFGWWSAITISIRRTPGSSPNSSRFAPSWHDRGSIPRSPTAVVLGRRRLHQPVSQRRSGDALCHQPDADGAKHRPDQDPRREPEGGGAVSRRGLLIRRRVRWRRSDLRLLGAERAQAEDDRRGDGAGENGRQCATDSKSHLGGIRRANQGVFEILARDQCRGAMSRARLPSGCAW